MNATNATTPFINRFKQVAMTLIASKWILGFYALCLVLALLSSPPQLEDGTVEGAFFYQLGIALLILLSLFPVLIYGISAKLWFIKPEARLMPGYAVPHATFPLAMLLLHYLFLPLAIAAPTLNVNPIGLSALIVCVAGSILLAFDRGIFLFVGIAILLGLFSPEVRDFWFHTAPNYQIPHTLLLTAGWLLVVFWLRKQTTFHEEKEGYGTKPVLPVLGSSSRLIRSNPNQVSATLLSCHPTAGKLIDFSFDHFLKKAGKSLEQLIGRSGSAIPLPMGVTFALLMGLPLLTMFAALALFIPETSHAIPFQIVMSAVIMPGTMSQQIWTVKRPLMGSELLRPNSRRSYFNALFHNTLTNALGGIAIYLLEGLGMIAWLAPEWISLKNITLFIAATLIGNLVFTSFAIWGTSFKSKILAAITAMIPILIGMVVFISWMTWQILTKSSHIDGIFEPANLFMPIVFALIGSLALGLIMLRVAYRKWMRTEIG